jgi:DNA helicase-2/ATP-dependent DNA helicase PcrA
MDGNKWKPPPRAAKPAPVTAVRKQVQSIGQQLATTKALPPPPKGGEWSSYQKTVFEDVATGAGHTVVEAYAGSAKTTTIVGALSMTRSNERVFFSAFNKRIVDELKERVPWTIDVNTLHSYGLRAVKAAYGDHVRPNTKRVRGLLDEMCNDKITFETRGQLAKLVSLAKNTLVDDRDDLDLLIDTYSLSVGCSGIHTCSLESCGRRSQFVQLAQDVLQRCRVETHKGEIDFDDMIWLPVANDLSMTQYDRLFVDECQDLNPTQVELVKRAVKASGRFTAVGDARQAIYLFRGADSNSIHNLREHFGAKTLPLPICYRCPVAVVKLAQEIVPSIEPAPGAPQGMVGEILSPVMYEVAQPGDFVLSRANAPLLDHALRFLRENKRVIICGRDIGNMLLAFVRKSKQTTTEDLLKFTKEWLAAEQERLLGRTPPRIEEFRRAMDTAQCITVLCDGCDSVQEVIEKIDHLFTDADDKNSIVLSTVHKAKGLETNRVFVLVDTFRCRWEYWERRGRHDDWRRDMWTNSQTREELNIYYVAITRAKRELMLTKSPPKNSNHFGTDI